MVLIDASIAYDSLSSTGLYERRPAGVSTSLPMSNLGLGIKTDIHRNVVATVSAEMAESSWIGTLNDDVGTYEVSRRQVELSFHWKPEFAIGQWAIGMRGGRETLFGQSKESFGALAFNSLGPSCLFVFAAGPNSRFEIEATYRTLWGGARGQMTNGTAKWRVFDVFFASGEIRIVNVSGLRSTEQRLFGIGGSWSNDDEK